MLRRLLTIALTYFSIAAPLWAQQTQLQWGIDRTTTPYNIDINLNGVWYQFATITSGGATNLVYLSNLGTGVATALGTNVGSPGAFVVNGGALGTPSSGLLTNTTGLPLTTGVTGLLSIANGGTGTATPAIVAGTNVSVTGSWPNQTINSTSSMSSALLQDQKSSGTDGGTCTSGAWRTRTLNTEVFDTGSNITLASNEFTPNASGVIQWSAPAYNVDEHQTRLYNVTDAGAAGYGTSNYGDNGNFGASISVGAAQVVAGKTYRIEHRCAVTQATSGFGTAGSFGGTEVYTQVLYSATN